MHGTQHIMLYVGTLLMCNSPVSHELSRVTLLARACKYQAEIGLYHTNASFFASQIYIYVTGFMKTVPNGTRNEIQFIADC